MNLKNTLHVQKLQCKNKIIIYRYKNWYPNKDGIYCTQYTCPLIFNTCAQTCFKRLSCRVEFVCVDLCLCLYHHFYWKYKIKNSLAICLHLLESNWRWHSWADIMRINDVWTNALVTQGLFILSSPIAQSYTCSCICIAHIAVCRILQKALFIVQDKTTK